MSDFDSEQAKARQEAESRVRQQIAFASGLFQGDITIRTLLESLAEGVVITDNSGTILLVNSYAAQMFGYQEQELIGKPHAVLIPERFRQVHEEHQRHFFAQPKIRPMGELLDLSGLRRDGSEFPLEICLSFLETISGVFILAFVSDITIRKQFEQHLLESEQRFTAFMRHLPVAAWLKDLEGRYVFVNTEAERIFSTPLSALLGKTDEEIFPSETARRFMENDQRVLAEDGNLRTIEALDQANHTEHLSIVNKFSIPGPDGKPALVCGVALDITESRRLEAEVQRLATFPIMNPDPILELDADGQMTFSNPAARRVLESVGYQNGVNPFLPEDLPAILQSLRDRKEGQFNREVEIDGRFFEERIHVTLPFRALRIYTMDITERRRVEKALKDSEEKFCKIFSLAPVGMAISTLSDGRFIEINDAGERLSGYPRDEVIGRTSTQFSIWRDASERAQVIAEVSENGSVREREMRMKDKTGHDFWGLYSAVIIEIKGEKHLLSLVSDIDERKKAQDALRESEERFRLMADTAPVLIWMSGTDSLCTFFNKAWLVFTGRSFEQEQGNGWTEGVHPGDRDRCSENYLSAFSDRLPFQMEYRLRRADGEYRWIFDTGVPRFMPDGDFVGYIGSCFDITERKYAEQEIKRLNESLTQRAAELEAANEELEAFNYTVAHDLRQPLNIINSCCQVIERLYGDTLAEECKEHIELAYKTTLRMDRLIEALLNFSRMGQVEPRREDIDLGMLAHEVIGSLQQTEPEREVDFQIAGGMVANADAGLLRVVLSNLLGNAWKYTRVRERAVIEFGVSDLDSLPIYFVRDNGAGFDQADADKLFAPFQRLPGAEKQRGSGIGLATVERIIRRHGGKVWAEGEPGKGSCFYFTLPER